MKKGNHYGRGTGQSEWPWQDKWVSPHYSQIFPHDISPNMILK